MSAHAIGGTDLAARASAAASGAARASGVRIRPLESIAELQAASDLVALIWDEEEGSKLPAALLRAFAHAGNYVQGAFDDDVLVGFSVGFAGLEDGAVKVHSHITGVRPDYQSRAVGYALKQDQRAWALDRGIELIEWTTDPLVRRNGFFNLQKLGAEMTAFHVDFYGRMSDGVNAGDETDRVVVRWDLRGERATLAAERALPEPPSLGGARPILTQRGEPAVVPTDGPLCAAVPPDIVALRREDPSRAHAWRLALRGTMGQAIAAGYRATGMTRDGWYLLTR